jgi:tetratricopeptide (TPR) repeat protein
MRLDARRRPITITRAGFSRLLPRRGADLALWLLGGLVLLSIVGFAGYYYYDRYVHQDEKILDREATHIEAMILQDPQNADLRVSVATYYVDGGLLDLAIQQCQEALKITPDHQGALFVLANAYEKKGDLASATSNLERLVALKTQNPLSKIDTQFPGIYFQLAGLYDRQKQTDKAVDALKAAIALDRTDADSMYALGAIYQRQGAHADAVSQFVAALRFDPYWDKPYQGLATSYAALGKPNEAAYAKGMAAFAQEKYSDAARQLEAVVATSPDMIPAYLGLGLSYEQLGKRDQAKQALQQYLSANPTDMLATQAMARLNQEVKP